MNGVQSTTITTKSQIVNPNYPARRQEVESTDSRPYPIQYEMTNSQECLFKAFKLVLTQELRITG